MMTPTTNNQTEDEDDEVALRKRVLGLSPEELQERVAELIGWRLLYRRTGSVCLMGRKDGSDWVVVSEYSTSRDAIMPAVYGLLDVWEQKRYIEVLRSLVPRQDVAIFFPLVVAEAMDHARAFVIVKEEAL